jgi:hypothetical protein
MALAIGMFACTDLDDVNERLDNLEAKVKQLEGLIDAANLDIQANKALIDVEGKKLKVLSYKPLADGSGYELTMSDNSKIVLKNGQDGKEQIVGVKKDADGKLYWTINGEFMMAGGQKVLAQGADGQPGATPMMTVDKDGFWQVSTDGGKTWTNVKDANGNDVKAKGEDGKPGEPGKDAATDLSIKESEDGKTITITFNGQTYILPISRIEEVTGPKLPLEYVAEYNVAPDGVSFVTSHANDVSGYFTYNDAINKFASDKNFMIDGNGYHLPSRTEWIGIVPDISTSFYYVERYSDGNNKLLSNIEEEITIAGETKKYQSDYLILGENAGQGKFYDGYGTSYAIRLKSDDNTLLSAWRYEYKTNPIPLANSTAEWPKERSKPKVLVITARLLGPDFTGTVDDISKPEFWQSNNKKDITRIFSAALQNDAPNRELTDDDSWSWGKGYYRSSDKAFGGTSYGLVFDGSSATIGIERSISQNNTVPVRLFSNE